jgi:outer membrane protein W
MRTKSSLLALLIIFSVIGLAPRATEAGRLGSYVALKGGIYSPSKSFNLSNVNVETTFDSNTRTGVDGELAIGHFFLPTLALELGIGYFRGTGSVAGTGLLATSDQVDFDVVPVLVSAKVFMPAGPIDPYGELGIGVYFTKVDISNNLNTFNGSTTFGLHTGVGLNVNINPAFFVGVEGRYVWANPSFGDQKIKLNDTEYTLNGFELNGFTTTLALGYNF